MFQEGDIVFFKYLCYNSNIIEYAKYKIIEMAENSAFHHVGIIKTINNKPYMCMLGGSVLSYSPYVLTQQTSFLKQYIRPVFVHINYLGDKCDEIVVFKCLKNANINQISDVKWDAISRYFKLSSNTCATFVADTLNDNYIIPIQNTKKIKLSSLFTILVDSPTYSQPIWI